MPEKAELDDGISDEFRKIFEKFSFRDAAASEVSIRTSLICNCLFYFIFLQLGCNLRLF